MAHLMFVGLCGIKNENNACSCFFWGGVEILPPCLVGIKLAMRISLSNNQLGFFMGWNHKVFLFMFFYHVNAGDWVLVKQPTLPNLLYTFDVGDSRFNLFEVCNN